MKRMLALMLAVLLAMPNTAVARYFGVGVVEAYAEGHTKTISLANEAVAYEVQKDTLVTVEAGDNYLAVISDSEIAPPSVSSGEAANPELWKASGDIVVPGNAEDGTEYSIYWYRAAVDGEGNFTADEATGGTITLTVDNTAPVISSISVSGIVGHDAYEGIAEDGDDSFSRVVNASDGTVTITAETDDDDAVISFAGTNVDSKTGVVNSIGTHTDIVVKATDKAGNEATKALTGLTLYVQEPVTVTAADEIEYTGNPVDTEKFTPTGHTIGNEVLSYSYSYDGTSESEGLEPKNVGTYYVKAKYAADLDAFALPTESEWTPFSIKKAAAEVSEAPTAATVDDYTGEAQQLFATAGTATNGTMYYGVNTENNANTATYTKTKPTKTDAGTYYLFYYAKGATNYSDSVKTATDPQSVTIAKVDVSDDSELTVGDYDGETGSVTLTASLVKPATPVTLAVPDGKVTFQKKVDSGNFADIASDGSQTVELEDGIAEATVSLGAGHVYAFQAIYTEGTNYNEKTLAGNETVDIKAPVLDETVTKCEATATDAGKITVQADKDSTAYYVVSSNELSDLTSGAAIKEAAISGGYTLSGNEVLTADNSKAINLSGLTLDTTYYVYLVAQDDAGNYSEIFVSDFTTNAEASGATVTIDKTNLKYGGTISATITDNESRFAEADGIEFTWSVDGQDPVVHEVTEGLTDSLELNDNTWYNKVVNVSAKIPGYTAITADTGESTVGKANITAVLSGNFVKEYDNTTNVVIPDDFDLTLSGKVNPDDSVSINNIDEVTFAYDSADIGADKTVTSSALTLAGDDATLYALTNSESQATLTAQKITKVTLSANDVVMPENYALLKDSEAAAFTENGSMTIAAGKKVGDDDVGLTSALTATEVTLDGLDNITTPGEFTGAVTYTLEGTNADNYTFKNDDGEDVNTITISGIPCSVTGSITLVAGDVEEALASASINKVYNGTADGGEITITQMIGGNPNLFRITLTYDYQTPNAGEQNLTFTGITAKDDATGTIPYVVTNESGVCTALNNSSIVKGTITKKPLGTADIYVNGIADNLDDLGFAKPYDGTPLTTTNTVYPVTLGTGVVEDDTVELNISSIEYSDNSKNVYGGVGSVVFTLSGTDVANYAFGEQLEDSLTLDDVPMVIAPLELTFTGITTSQPFSDTVTETIAADVLNKVSNLASGDNKNDLGLELMYQDAAGNTTDEISTDGTYKVYVVGVADTNYTAPDDSIATIAVNAQDAGNASMTISNKATTSKYEYGERLTATFEVGDSGAAFARNYLTSTWYYNDGEKDITISSNIFYVGNSTGSDYFDVVDPSLIGKSIKCKAKLDGYNAVDSAGVTIAARELTVTKLTEGSSATKTYDGTNTVTDFSGIGVVFTGALEGEDVTVSPNTATFSATDAGTNLDVTIATFKTEGEDKNNYRVTTTDATYTGIGTITPVYINPDNVVVSNDFYLKKTTEATEYQIGAGSVDFGSQPGVNSEALKLVGDYNADNITLGTGESHSETGTYTDATVNYTVKKSDNSDTTNYSFDQAASKQTISMDNIKCVVVGKATITPSDIIEAIDNASVGALDKTYDGTNKGSISVNVSEYDVTVDFSYASKNYAADAQSLTFVGVSATKDGVQYDLTNVSEIRSAFAGKNYTGKISKIVLDEDDLVVGDNEALSTLSYNKIYDGQNLAISDHNGAVTLSSNKIIGTEVVTASDTAYTENPTDVGTGTGTVTVTLDGADRANYCFEGDANTLSLTDVPWEITKLEADAATMDESVYTATAGTTPQMIRFTAKVAAKIASVVGASASFGTIDVSGNGAQYIAASPTAAAASSEYTLTYNLTAAGATLSGNNLVATFTIPVTDGTNYAQDVVINLTLCPRASATVEITEVGTSDTVEYGNAITEKVTVNSSAVTENYLVSVYDSQSEQVTDAYPVPGNYKMVAVYDDGDKYGQSSEHEFTISKGTLSGNSFAISATEVTKGGTEPTVALANTDLSLGTGVTITSKYVTTGGEASAASSFDSIKDTVGTYDVYVSTSAAGNYAQATDLKLDQTVEIKDSTPTPPGPTPPGPEPVAVTGVTVAPKTATISLSENKTVVLTATVAPADASDKTVTWTQSSTDGGEVTFSSTTANPVTVTASKAGTVTITATTIDGSKTDTATVTVTAAPVQKVATPTFTPAAGQYTTSQNVVIATATEGAVIHYTTDGTTPTATSAIYSSPITVDKTKTIKAIAVKDGMDNSDIAVANYIIDNKVSTPTFSPAAGTYKVSQNVAISTATEGATIYYTTDGTAPTTGSTKFTTAIFVDKTMTIKAIAVKDGMDNSAVATAEFVIDKKAVPVTKVEITPATTQLLKGETCKLNAVITPENATDKTVTWTTSDDKTVSVTAAGVVTGIKAGQATITAKAGGVSATATVTVVEDAAKEKVINETDDDTKVEIAEDLNGKTISGLIGSDASDPNTVVVVDKDGNIQDTKVWVGGVEKEYTYTGKAITPEPHVYDGTKKLVKGTDYTLSYNKNKTAGTASVTVKFKGNYKNDPQTVSFAITPAELGEDVIVTAAAQEAGKAQKPKLTYVMKSTGASVGTSKFTVTPSGKITIAEGDSQEVTVTAKDTTNFKGTATVTVEAVAKTNLISKAKITINPKNYTYTGEEIVPEDTAYTVKIGSTTLTLGTDYEVAEILNNVEPGKATVVIEGTGDYKGSKTANFTIKKGMEPNADSISVLINGNDENITVPYAKGGVTPDVAVYLDGKKLVNKTDYTVKFTGNKAVGTASAIVTYKGKYKGSKTVNFEVTKQSLANLSVVAEDKVKSTKADFYKNPKLTIKDLNGKSLNKKDYTIGTDYTYDEATGEVKVTLKGAGNYSEEAYELTYRVITKDQDIKNAKAAKIADQSYTGSPIVLTDEDLKGVLTLGGKTLVAGTDFEIDEQSFRSNIKKGTASFVVRGKDATGGVKTLKFKIVKKTIKWNGVYQDGGFTK